MMNRVKTVVAVLVMMMGMGVAMANTIVAPNPKKDPVQAFNYVYNIAVTQNIADKWAQYLLGKYYETGYGTKKDTDKAYVWYSLSTDHDYKPAIEALSDLKKGMSATQIKADEAMTVKTRNASAERAIADIKNQVGY